MISCLSDTITCMPESHTLVVHFTELYTTRQPIVICFFIVMNKRRFLVKVGYCSYRYLCPSY